MLPRSPPLSASSTDCANCVYLVTEIRNQIDAFKTMTMVNPNLSSQILIDGFEQLTVPRDTKPNATDLAVHQSGGKAEIFVEEKKDQVSKADCSQLIEGTDQNFENNVTSISDPEDPEQDQVDKKCGQIPTVANHGKETESENELKINLKNKLLLTAESLLAADEFIRTSWKGKDRVHHCLKCSYTQTQKRVMRLHVRRVHFFERMACPSCPRRFYGPKELAIHARTCLGNKVPTGLQDLWSKMKTAEETFRKFKMEYELKIGNWRKMEKEPDDDDGPILVSNPFDGFDLSQALAVQVKIERLTSLPTNITSTKVSNNGRGRKRKVIGPKSRMGSGTTNNDNDVPVQKKKRKVAASKSLILNSIFGSQLKSGGCDLTRKNFIEKQKPPLENEPPDASPQVDDEEEAKILKKDEIPEHKPQRVKRVKLQHIDDKIRTQLVICGLGEGSETEELTESGFECVVCDKAYRNLSLMRRHVRMTHF